MNSKEKNAGEKSWFCHKYRIIQQDHRKYLLRACNFNSEVFIYFTRNFFPDSLTCTDHDQPAQTQGMHRYQHFPKMPILCSTFETKCDMEELDDALNQLLLSHHATHFSIVSHPMHFQLHISSFTLPC